MGGGLEPCGQGTAKRLVWPKKGEVEPKIMKSLNAEVRIKRWAFSHKGRNPRFSSRRLGGEQLPGSLPTAQAATEECGGSENLEVLVDLFPRRQASYIPAQPIPVSGWLPPG